MSIVYQIQNYKEVYYITLQVESKGAVFIRSNHQFSGGGNTFCSIRYTANGNITNKSDIGFYDYAATKQNAVGQIYNLSGTAVSTEQSLIGYSLTGKVATMSRAGVANYYNIYYGPDDQRTKSTENDGSSTIYLPNYEVRSNGEVLHYVQGPDGLCAVVATKNANSWREVYYVVTDYQGSLIAAIHQTNGTIVQEWSYDAWGRRRNPYNWQDYTSGTFTDKMGFNYLQLITRGYTGHEHIDDLALINMNGRIYDPRLGRFMSPDPYVQDPSNSQSHNRYSYCVNNPLKYTDPNGYWWGWDDLAAFSVGFVVGWASYGLSTGNFFTWKAFTAGVIGGVIADVGWNTMGVGDKVLAAYHGAGNAPSLSAGFSAVFSSIGGCYGTQFAVLTGLNTLAHKDQIAAADKSGSWNGVWALGGYMAASVLSTSLNPLSIGAKEGGLGLKQFAGVVLTNNLSDNFKNGEFDLHSFHVGPIGYDWKYRNDETWGGFYSIFSKGLSGDQRFGMGFEMVLGLSLIKTNIEIPKYKWSTLLDRSGRFLKMPHNFKSLIINTAKVGYYARRTLDLSDTFFQFYEQKTTMQHWYDTQFNEDGTFRP